MLLKIAVVVFVAASTSFWKSDAVEAPYFKRAPLLERLAVVNDSISLRCKVRGSPKPFIEWLLNGEQLSITKRIRIESKSLEINQVQVSDSGNYSCKASNEHGILWANFTLKVKEKEEEFKQVETDLNDAQSAPKWSPKKDTVDYIPYEATKDATLNCDVRGYPTPTITWYKGEQEIIPEEDKYVMHRWKLKVLELTLKDSGNYTCVVSNKLGSINWTFHVDVIQRLPFAPIIEDVKDLTIVSGQDAIFTCKIVASDSQPILQWLQHYKVNDSYVNENDEPYVHVLKQSGFLKTVDDPQTLRLRNVTEEDEGWYSCVVTNTAGMNYKSAYLTVLSAPEWSPKKDTVDYIPSEATKDVTLNCDVRGYPTPTITWYNGEQEIMPQEGKYVVREWKLKVLELTLKDSGNYTCVVSNKLGSINWTFHVDVIQEPSTTVPENEVKDGPVIFTARIDTLQAQHITNGGVILFPNIITNIGGGYNSLTGVFVAPKTGIYMFSCSLLYKATSLDTKAQTNAEIVKNQSVLARVFTKGEWTSLRDQASQTVFSHVNRGEHVFVRWNSDFDLSLLGEMYTTFSGHLVWSE